MNIHPLNMTYDTLPTVFLLLDSMAFFWFIILVTVGITIYCIVKLWHLHSLPKYMAKDKGYSQARFVFWLCILGLIMKPLWALAVLIMVVDWDSLHNWLHSCFKGEKGDTGSVGRSCERAECNTKYEG